MAFRRFASLAVCALLAASAPTGVAAPPAGPDLTTIDGLLATLYSSFTCGPGSPPRMDVYRTLCQPKACFVRMTKDGPIVMTVDEFVASFMDRYKTGVIKTFVEEEIARRTERFGPIVQVWSTYRKGLNAPSPAEHVRGINGFQLMNDGTRWWLSGAIWMDERPDAPIPAEYLADK